MVVSAWVAFSRVTSEPCGAFASEYDPSNRRRISQAKKDLGKPGAPASGEIVAALVELLARTVPADEATPLAHSTPQVGGASLSVLD